MGVLAAVSPYKHRHTCDLSNWLRPSAYAEDNLSIPLAAWNRVKGAANTRPLVLTVRWQIYYISCIKHPKKYGQSASPYLVPLHSGCLDPKNILSTIDPPPGVPGVSKNHIFFSQMKVFSFCAKIAPKRHKLKKTIKIEEKMSKNPVFLDIFKYSSILGQS